VGGQQFSSANDVRLTQPTFGYPFGSKVLVDDDCSVDRLTTFWPFVFLNSRLQSVDLLDDGFTADDLVLLDTSPFWAGVLQVEVGDVRLTPVTWLGETHAAGTTVESGDKDEWKTTNFIPWNNIRYYDVNGDGLTNDDPIIVDSLGGGSVSNLDVRLTSYAGFAAGSKVLDGDGDPYFSLGLITLPNVQAGFFDVDDRRYDEDDYVYIDLYGDNFVTVNDVRLTGNGAPPPPPELMEGDVTGDNCVDTVDAMLIAQYRAGLISLTADQLKCADTTDDGSSDMIDAMHIKQWRVDPDGSLGVLAKPLWESPADDDMLHPDDCRP
ncbi:MAG: dockerin type I repeat-containing protein, partial [ANME-2 cluster archaeon]|nr:dockerin type I repeat-containing protein [ANME-2 cluster archaeon]